MDKISLPTKEELRKRIYDIIDIVRRTDDPEELVHVLAEYETEVRTMQDLLTELKWAFNSDAFKKILTAGRLSRGEPITLPELALLSHYSRMGLYQRVRSGKLKGEKVDLNDIRPQSTYKTTMVFTAEEAMEHLDHAHKKRLTNEP